MARPKIIPISGTMYPAALDPDTIPLTPAKQPSTQATTSAVYRFLIVKPDVLKKFIRGASKEHVEHLLKVLIDMDNERLQGEGWEAVE